MADDTKRISARVAALPVVAAAFIAATPAAAKWQLIGTTYNSVAFLDLASARQPAIRKIVRVMRISGQPAKDRWRAVDQRIAVDCAAREFTDAGSTIEQFNGSIVRYLGSPARRNAGTRGLFADLYAVACEGRTGIVVADPKAWTARNFKVGSLISPASDGDGPRE